MKDSKIDPVPMTLEEIKLQQMITCRYIIQQQKMADEIHKDVSVLPDIKAKLEIAKRTNKKYLDRINNIEEVTP